MRSKKDAIQSRIDASTRFMRLPTLIENQANKRKSKDKWQHISKNFLCEPTAATLVLVTLAMIQIDNTYDTCR